MNQNLILKVSNVSNTYVSRKSGLFGEKKEKKVLEGVNLEIKKGEIFGLAGASGSGKTTLCRCILGLIEYSGEIMLNNNYVIKGTNAGRLGIIFQDPSGALNPAKKTGWLLQEPLRVHKYGTKKEMEKEADRMLSLVGLDSSYKNRYPFELSSGQKQRISIGCALILKPDLLLADEPVSALDVSNGAQIINLFRELNETLGLSMLFISHNTELLSFLCERTAVLENGKTLCGLN